MLLIFGRARTELTRHSKYSALDCEEESAFGKLERRWNIFVRYILDTYGAEG